MTRNRQYSWPDNHWNWPIDLSHQHGVRAGEFVFTGGQADLDSHGNVQHPDDVERQVVSVTEYMLAILADLGAQPADLVRLVVYFVGDVETELLILDTISRLIGESARPVVNSVPVPALCYPGMVIELEGVAMTAESEQVMSRRHIRLDSLPQLTAGFSHVVVCDHMVFVGDMSAIDGEGNVQQPNDVVAQSTIMMEQAGEALRAAGVSYSDVLKLNVFYVGDGTAENWEQPALIRQRYFNDPGPAATGISLPAFARPGLMTKIALTAAVTTSLPQEQGSEADKQGSDGRAGNETTGHGIAGNKTPGNKTIGHGTAGNGAAVNIAAGNGTAGSGTDSGAVNGPNTYYSWPEGHWNWTTALPYKHGNRCGRLIHLGGQVSLDEQARVLDPTDIVAQTKRALKYIETILADLGSSLDDIVKVTTFYEGQASAADLHENLQVRSSAFKKPGPATTGIPIPSLVYENMRVEIEVIAVADTQ